MSNYACRRCGVQQDMHARESMDCVWEPVDRPEGCVCSPIEWEGRLPRICGSYDFRLETGTCHCGHERECHERERMIGDELARLRAAVETKTSDRAWQYLRWVDPRGKQDDADDVLHDTPRAILALTPALLDVVEAASQKRHTERDDDLADALDALRARIREELGTGEE